MAEDPRSAEALYDDSAARWVRRAPSSLSDFTGRPPTLALCEPVAGLRVLDLGCGEGYCARHLRRAGAGDVLGVDVSGRMIEAARAEEAREPLGIRYEQGDAVDLARFAAGEFDLVLAMFLFNYLDVAETRRCMAEVARVLRSDGNGKFVFAGPHPALPWMRRTEPPFYFDVGDSSYFGARDGRFPGRIWKRDGTPLDVQLRHKTFEDYFDALAAAGFTRMPVVRELGVTPELLAMDPAFFGPLEGAPIHVAVAVIR